MSDPFKKTKVTDRGYEAFLPSFQYKDDVPIPTQVLRLPEGMFKDDAFPEVGRHWYKVIRNNEERFAPPILCTKDMESTNGNCLSCYGKTTGQISMDRGSKQAGVDIVVPVYNHGRYKSTSDGKRELMHPNVPITDEALKNSLIVGGLEVAWCSPPQYRKIRGVHENVQNECAGCGGHMVIESLNCEHCSAPIFDAQQITMLPQEDFQRIIYDEITCTICNQVGTLDPERRCTQCKQQVSKTLFDVVFYSTRTKVPVKSSDGKPKTKTEYTYAEVRGMEAITPNEEELKIFFERMHSVVTKGPTIAQQREKLGIDPPPEWLTQGTPTSSQNSVPYGG